MADPEGLYYAYAKNINDDSTSRWAIRFATRDVANTWYRKVLDSVKSGYNKFEGVRRVNPQFYTHDPSKGSIHDTINDARVAIDLRGKICFTLLDDRNGRQLSVIPVLNYVEHTSGSKFYIRSISQPDIYWYLDSAADQIYASQKRRTKFTITIADTTWPEGTIMIGSDEVLITVDQVNLGVTNHSNQLGFSDHSFPFKFSSFNGDFEIDSDEGQGPAYLGVITRIPNEGGRWELVR